MTSQLQGGSGLEGALCALRPVSGFHFPTGPVEEADLQVFPDTGSDTEILEAVGDGQACVTVSLGVGGLVERFRAAWPMGPWGGWSLALLSSGWVKAAVAGLGAA